MAFTNTLTTDIGKIRLEIGDLEQGKGPRPDRSNFSDEQLQVWLTRETHVMRASAAACEVLAREWAREVDIKDGPFSESASQVAKAYKEQATAIRAVWGETPSAATDGGGYAITAAGGDNTLAIDYDAEAVEWE